MSAHPSIDKVHLPLKCVAVMNTWGLWSALIDSGTEHLTGEWDGWMDGWMDGRDGIEGVAFGRDLELQWLVESGWHEWQADWVGATLASRFGLEGLDLLQLVSPDLLRTPTKWEGRWKAGGSKVEWHGRGVGYVRAACWPERRRASF